MRAVKRIFALARSRAAGAAVAQIWQAFGSFGLQIVAAWTLGAQGLGLISMSLGVIVLTTALASGMIGDSLVILDRANPATRGALQAWALVLGALTALVAGTAMGVTVLTPLQAVLFAGALVAFQFEELIRRVFMGVMQFWRLVALDSVAVITALAIIGVAAATHAVTVEAFFAALLVGQVAGIVVGVLLLPATERVWVGMRGSDLRRVVVFGAWRGAQVAVPQLMLTVSRVLVTAFAGGAALGLIEGARIFVAPVLLTVQGLGSYLLSSYVRDSKLGVPALHRRAWRASLTMMACALLAGTVIVIAVPYLSHLVSGSTFDIERLTVAGWVVYVMASASFQPFASLAAVRGGQRRVFFCRITDAGFAVALLTSLLALGVSPAWTPVVLAAGLFVGGTLVRHFVLAPLSRTATHASTSELRMSNA
ncbi:MAG: hypothetical protein QM582_16785 [Micropruina sp.]|uniref:hypothetical protein n=1 Tax=Micropruina sp. TaxID=2737536 RepID=UPI0039E3FB6E